MDTDTKKEHKMRSRGISKDMSSAAILRRLNIASNLHQTATRLARGEFPGKRKVTTQQ